MPKCLSKVISSLISSLVLSAFICLNIFFPRRILCGSPENRLVVFVIGSTIFFQFLLGIFLHPPSTPHSTQLSCSCFFHFYIFLSGLTQVSSYTSSLSMSLTSIFEAKREKNIFAVTCMG